jgi:hypothetical protein
MYLYMIIRVRRYLKHQHCYFLSMLVYYHYYQLSQNTEPAYPTTANRTIRNYKLVNESEKTSVEIWEIYISKSQC